MKVLFGYNGSKAADAAIADLKCAGLPASAEVLVLSVAEAWLPTEETRVEALHLADKAADRIRSELSSDRVTSRVSFGSPAAEILNLSEQFQPDLIVLAEREQVLNERNIFLGTTTQRILTEADCSVRIARGHARSNGSACRIIVGFDGSRGSQNAVEAVAGRCWPRETEISLAVVADNAALSSLGRFAPQMSNPNFAPKVAVQWGQTLADAALRKLSSTEQKVSLYVMTGNPKEVLIELAKSRNANSVFVGPHCRGNSFERYLIGSVSSAVAARAECSVEVVRSRSALD